MKKGRYQAQSKPINKWLFVLISFVLILIVMVLWLLLKPEPIQVELPNGQQMQPTEDVEKKPDSIAIPGYEGIGLEANTRQQTVGLPNPGQNTCYFRITLLLEDGTVLWVSDLVEPGEISDPIYLEKPLETGTYPNSILKYECYTMDGSMRALNGAETKLTLRVN